MSKALADDEDDQCLQLKANYDQCFDQWYKDVFLQTQSNGQVGCQAEYEVYSRCFIKQLRRDKSLMDGIASVMTDDMRQRWDAHLTSHAQQQQAHAKTKKTKAQQAKAQARAQASDTSNPPNQQ